MNHPLDFSPLSRSFFRRDTETVARALLGKLLVRRLDCGEMLAGRIVETEAYLGEDDPSCHAVRGKTERTRLFWGEAGHAYIYLCMGVWYCLNVVAEPAGKAGCALIRAVEPITGIESMKQRRPKARNETDLCSGPGKLCQAMEIGIDLNGTDMTNGALFIAGASGTVKKVQISPRIGISKAVDWPLRFFEADNPHVSRAKPGRVPKRRRR